MLCVGWPAVFDRGISWSYSLFDTWARFYNIFLNDDGNGIRQVVFWAIALNMKTNKNKTFCGFFMGSNQYWAERVFDLCVYFMTGTPEVSTERSFKNFLWLFHG